MNREILFNRIIRKHIHSLIVWYLRRCGGAFHYGAYGENGRYIALMNDVKYHEYQKL